MATIRQIQANRLNAQKSTGPRSAEGKSVSRFNSLKHGAYAESSILRNEDPAEFEALAAEYHGLHRPANAQEILLVDTLIRADWEIRRYRRAETQLINACMDHPDVPPEYPLGFIIVKDGEGSKALDRTFRRLQAAERSFFRALNQLRRLRQEPKPAKPQPAEIKSIRPAEPPPAPSPQTREIGFAPSFPPSPAARRQTPALCSPPPLLARSITKITTAGHALTVNGPANMKGKLA